MRLAWATDLHLNWLGAAARGEFYGSLARTEAEAFLLGGDFGQADSVGLYLSEVESVLQRPVYFVLGNHDFYNGSIAQVRSAVARKASSSRWLRYLTASGPVWLTPATALMGHDGWADGRLGDFFGSPVMLNDYLLIAELKNRWRGGLYRKLRDLGDEAAARLEESARECLARCRRVLVLTHVPPFREACWHEGRISNDLYLPHFASRAAGERLAAVMQQHPDAFMSIFCGHTHSAGFAQILPNLEVHTGGAEYGHPAVASVIEV